MIQKLQSYNPQATDTPLGCRHYRSASLGLRSRSAFFGVPHASHETKQGMVM